MEKGYVTARDGTRLYYKDWGQGRPIVLAHGWPVSSDMFDDLAIALNEGGFRTVAYDRRGFGRSDQPATGYDYDTMADDMAAVIDALGLKDVTLLGFSMGGGEVVRYLSRQGAANVHSAILISSVVPLLVQTDDNAEGVPMDVLNEITEGLHKDRPDFFETFFKQFYGVGMLSSPVSDATLAWTQQMAMQAGLLPTLQCAKAFGTTDFREDLPRVTVPTLLIHGTSDKTVPIDGTSRKALLGLPNARLIEYDGSPHGVPASDKERLASDVLEFLGGNVATTLDRAESRTLERNIDAAVREDPVVEGGFVPMPAATVVTPVT